MAYATKALTYEEEVRLGLRKTPEAPQTIQVTYPKRYTNSAVAWVTKWVSEREYLILLQNQVDVQMIKRKGVVRDD